MQSMQLTNITGAYTAFRIGNCDAPRLWVSMGFESILRFTILKFVRTYRLITCYRIFLVTSITIICITISTVVVFRRFEHQNHPSGRIHHHYRHYRPRVSYEYTKRIHVPMYINILFRLVRILKNKRIQFV